MGCSVQISTHPLFRSRFHQAWLMFDPHINFRHPILIRSQDWTWSLHTYTTNKNHLYHWYTIDISLIYHWYTIDIPLIYHWYACPVDSHDRFLTIQFFPPEDAEDSGGEQCGATLSRYVCNFAIRDAQYRTSAIPRFKNWGSPAAPLEATLGGKPPHRVWVARYDDINIIYMCVYVRRLAILAMDKKHLFHTFTVICPWYTNNSWGFSSMQNYQRVFGSVWRRRRSADVSNAPKAQKLQDNFTQELRPPAAIINLYSCKGTRKHTTLKFGRSKLMFLWYFSVKATNLDDIFQTLGRSSRYDMVTDTSQTCWNILEHRGKELDELRSNLAKDRYRWSSITVGPSTSCWVDDISHRSSPSPSPWNYCFMMI